MTDGEHEREHPTEAKYSRLCRHKVKLETTDHDRILDRYHEQAHEDIAPVVEHVEAIAATIDEAYDTIDVSVDVEVDVDDGGGN